MASTYSTSLGLELIGQGEQSGTWAITGVQPITMGDATYTMTTYQGASDESRNAVLVLSGTVTSPQNLIAPAVEKVYLIKNTTGNTITIKTSGGTGAAIANGSYAQVYCDGTDFYNATPSGNTVTGNLSVSGSGSFGTTLAVTGNETVGGNLTVTGSVTAGSYVGITGRILQVVSSTFTAGYSTNNTSPTPTGFTTSITPSSTSSKILVLYCGPFANPKGAGGVSSDNAWLTMYRSGTNLAGSGSYFANLLNDDGNIYSSCAVSYTDSPATTSLITYQPYIWSQGGGALIYGCCAMTLLEIL